MYMKSLMIFLFCLCLNGLNVAAQKIKTFKINPGQKITEVVLNQDIYLYPDFINGTVYKRDDRFSNASLNYNSLLGEMQFITPAGDTLSLADENIIRSIVVNNDTFYYDKVCLKLVADYGEVKLASRQFIDFTNRQKIGGHGELTSASLKTYTAIVGDIDTKELTPNEIITLAKYQVLFIGDRFNHFKTVNKKNLLEIFANKEKELQKYLKENSVNFYNEEDIRKLIVFIK